MNDQSLLSNSARKTPVALLTRSIVWVCLSLGFLIVNAIRIFSTHQAGKSVGLWVYLQSAIWLVALVVWSYTGWKQLELRKSQRKVS